MRRLCVHLLAFGAFAGGFAALNSPVAARPAIDLSAAERAPHVHVIDPAAARSARASTSSPVSLESAPSATPASFDGLVEPDDRDDDDLCACVSNPRLVCPHRPLPAADGTDAVRSFEQRSTLERPPRA
jgi:hypothetical protein